MKRNLRNYFFGAFACFTSYKFDKTVIICSSMSVVLINTYVLCLFFYDRTSHLLELNFR